MKVQLETWGNGQGIKIPKSILNDSGISVGDYLMLKVESGKIILEKTFSINPWSNGQLSMPAG